MAVVDSRLLQGFLLLFLLVQIPLRQMSRLSVVLDPDIWWHLRVGQWILQHHAFPRLGLFSQFGENHPWMAYSWGFELVAAKINLAFGLLGLTVYMLSLYVVLAIILFSILRKSSGNFWAAWSLTAATLWAMNLSAGVGAGRPVMFTILLFIIELAILLSVVRGGSFRLLCWLPPLFLLWANLHIQFIYGLIVLGFFALTASVSSWARLRHLDWRLEPNRVPVLLWWGTFAGAAVATLINPYGIGLYRVIVGYARSVYPLFVIQELKAPNFRASSHFVELLLAGAAFYALGRRRIFDPFRLLLLAIVAAVSFRMARDAWFISIVSAMIIADVVRECRSQEQEKEQRFLGFGVPQYAAILLAVAAILACSAWDRRLSNETLLGRVSDVYPLEAVSYLQKTRPPGPLYNTLDWGGFLIGTLTQYPVSIDGRTDLYGDERLSEHTDVELGAKPWREDPALERANIVLLQSFLPLCRTLAQSPEFKQVYSDGRATIFLRQR